MTTQNIGNHTNKRLSNWYSNAKLDYNVDGNGSTSIKNNEVKIKFTENGILKEWSMCFYPEYIEFGVDYVFNTWMEEVS